MSGPDRHARSKPTRSGRTLLVAAALPVALACALLAPAPAQAGQQHHSWSSDPTVITTWNQVGLTTLLGDASKAPTESMLYLGFVNAAMYDAVVGIEGRYRPYRFDERAPHGASAVAAAAAAAHHVLSSYSPYAQANLDAQLDSSLAGVPDGWGETAGIAYGEAVAAHLVASREDDGRNAAVQFTKPPAPGVWRPTPPGLAPFNVPWMGAVTPLLVKSGAQFGAVGPPPAMTSWRYTRDFDEVKALGSAGSTDRTEEQTATATFFAGNAFLQMVNGVNQQIDDRGMGLVGAARLSAAVIMSIADAIISVWYAKYRWPFWRPITAITMADTDGNPATEQDPAWTPKLATPPYPDWISGYSGVAGAFTRALGRALQTHHLGVTLMSTAAPGELRTYATGKALNQEVIDARVWLGIHFRTADVKRSRVGKQVASWALDHYFRPTHCR